MVALDTGCWMLDGLLVYVLLIVALLLRWDWGPVSALRGFREFGTDRKLISRHKAADEQQQRSTQRAASTKQAYRKRNDSLDFAY